MILRPNGHKGVAAELSEFEAGNWTQTFLLVPFFSICACDFRMLRAVFRLLFGAPPFREPFQDPVLGVLIGCETGWSINVKKGMESFTFTIGGECQPSAALLSHAREILHDYSTFKTAVKRCIESESRDYPVDAKAEVAGLEIDRICLFWPDRPDDGMIFFRGSENDIGLWRCDYIARKPTGLGCDT